MFVYAARAEMASTVFVKFGVTNNPKKRLMAISCSCPARVDMIGLSQELSRSDAFSLEWVIHRALAKYRCKGEWFYASPKVLSAAKILRERSPDETKALMAAWAEEVMKFAVNENEHLYCRGFNADLTPRDS